MVKREFSLPQMAARVDQVYRHVLDKTPAVEKLIPTVTERTDST